MKAFEKVTQKFPVNSTTIMKLAQSLPRKSRSDDPVEAIELRRVRGNGRTKRLKYRSCPGNTLCSRQMLQGPSWVKHVRLRATVGLKLALKSTYSFSYSQVCRHSSNLNGLTFQKATPRTGSIIRELMTDEDERIS